MKIGQWRKEYENEEGARWNNGRLTIIVESFPNEPKWVLFITDWKFNRSVEKRYFTKEIAYEEAYKFMRLNPD